MAKRPASTSNKRPNLWKQWQRKAAGFSPEFLVLAGFVLFFWVGIGTYLTGRLPLASSQTDPSALNAIEHNKLAISFIWGLGSLLVIPYLAAIDARIKESEKKRITVSIQIPQTDLEYLSSVKHSLKQLPNQFNELDKSIDDLRRNVGENQFKQTLDSTFEEFTIRQEAVGGLCEGLRLEESDRTSIAAMIRGACDDTLPEHYSYDEVVRFRKCMYAYVRAWLVCSIQYGTFLPINSIFYQDPSSKEYYLSAIENLRNRFTSRPIDKFLKTAKSRGMVDRYMGKLAELVSQAEFEVNESLPSAPNTTQQLN